MAHSTLRIFLISSLSFFFCSLAAHASSDTIPGLSRPDSSISFLVLGDWGNQGSHAQKKVAESMGAAGKQLGISFIISTGDNFYPIGIVNTEDPQIIYTFDSVYTSPSLQVPWWVVLGNHDHKSNPYAQVDLTLKNQRWRMPSRYFQMGIKLGNDSMLLVFLDTEPFELELRHKAHDTLINPPSYTEKQLAWLNEVLAGSSARFKIVIGHHPLHTGGSRRHNSRTRKLRNLLQPIFYRNNVDLYLSGHEHQLEYLKAKGPTHYVISGSASETRHVGWLKRYRRFAARKNGFVAISISSKGWLLQVIDKQQRLLYQRMIVK